MDIIDKATLTLIIGATLLTLLAGSQSMRATLKRHGLWPSRKH